MPSRAGMNFKNASEAITFGLGLAYLLREVFKL